MKSALCEYGTKNRIALPFDSNSCFALLAFCLTLLAAGTIVFLFASQVYAAESSSTVVRVFPPDNYNYHRAPGSIIARFSEPLMNSSVSESTFTVKDSSGNNIPGTITMVLANGNYDPRFTMFKPQNSLKADETYTVKLDGFKDESGNNVAPYEWSFTITDPSKVIIKKGDESQVPPGDSSGGIVRDHRNLTSDNKSGSQVAPPSTSISEGLNYMIYINSITVLDKHEGLLSGDGEFEITVFAQGYGVNLGEELEVWKLPNRLYDVSNGETIYFPRQVGFAFGPYYSDYRKNIDSIQPLSIFTVGIENDNCGVVSPDEDSFMEFIQSRGHPFPYYAGEKVSQSVWDPLIKEYRSRWDDTSTCRFLDTGDQTNKHDILGTVTKWHDAPIQPGHYSASSTDGDFVLKYTIEVWGDAYTDSDKDGVQDSTDNCRNVSNQNQQNHDRDNMGDVCDPDDDNDGKPDSNDNCKVTYNPDQNDQDEDGKGDKCDLDADGDGILDRQQRFSEPQETID